jgi:TRAP-type uncharacterized transport system substrate-binding protein
MRTIRALVACLSMFLVVGFTVVFVGGISSARAQTGGYESHSPILGASCRTCPWGALADIVKAQMDRTGWNIRICYTCAGSETEVINVEKKFNGTSVPYNPASLEAIGVPASVVDFIEPPPPNGPVDFGIATPNFIWWGYQGTQTKAGFPSMPPYRDLRLVATIVSPVYLVVAATVQSGITDLSQIKTLVAAGKPVHILWDSGLFNTAAQEILAFYGVTQAQITAAGGSVIFGILPSSRTNFDVAIYTGDLSQAPEFNLWYQISQQFNLNYFQLPQTLLTQLQRDFDMIPLTMPTGFLKGIWQPIPTVGYIGNSVFGRADMPDKFAYDLAKAIDEHKDLLETGYEHFAYDPAQVWQAYGVPLAPGAERYYREKGYMEPRPHGNLPFGTND